MSKLILSVLASLLTLAHADPTQDQVRRRLGQPLVAADVPEIMQRELNARTQRAFGKNYTEVPVRRLLTTSFYAAVGGRDSRVAREIRVTLGKLGLPMNLSDAELALLWQKPDHPVFAPIKAIGVSTRTWNLLRWDLEPLRHVIDVIHALREFGYFEDGALRSNAVARMNRHLDAYLGEPAAGFDPRLALSEGRPSPAPMSMVECRRILDAMPPDDLEREVVRELMNRQRDKAPLD